MNIAIEIIDMVDDTHVLQDKHVQYGSVLLSWLGSDDRDQNIVGSQLVFSLLDETATDGYYKELYTYDENRFKVVLTNLDIDEIVFQGYLLAETYQEPYTNVNVFVNLSATDGLGLLKGKYFEDVEYNYEYSVVKILSNILQATGLQMNLHLSPAIENKHQKDYDQIYLDLAYYKDDKGVVSDLYTILQDVLFSMCCTVYQSNGVWVVEGINKRHIKDVNYKVYDYQGNFIENVTKVRNVLKYKLEPVPSVGIMPPVGVVNLTSTKSAVVTPDNLTEEKTDVIGFGLNNQNMVASAWQQYVEDFAALVSVDTGKVFLESIKVFDAGKYVTIKKPIYVQKGVRVKIECLFSQDALAELHDFLKYEISLGGTVLYSSENDVKVSFLAGGVPDLQIGTDFHFVYDFISNKEGYLDIKLWQPEYVPIYYPTVINLYLKEINIEVGNEVKTEYLLKSNNNYTGVKSIDLPITVDVNNTANGFLLAKQKEYSTAGFDYVPTMLYSFTFLGKNYAVFSLYDLSIIKNNADYVFINDIQLTLVELYFNFQGGDQMVMVTENLLDETDVITVNIKPLELVESKKNWSDFSDAVYPVALDAYEESVITVYERMYKQVALTMDAVAYGPMLFGDLFNFYYDRAYRYFYMLRLTWDLVNGKSNFNAVENIYNGYNDVVDIPVVEAGNDLLLTAVDDVVALTAVVQSNLPYTVLWEDVSEIPGSEVSFTDTTLENTNATNFKLSSGVLRVTVTNSSGLKATDEINYTLILDVDQEVGLISENPTPHVSAYRSGSPIAVTNFTDIDTDQLKIYYDAGNHPGNQGGGWPYSFGVDESISFEYPDLPDDVLLQVQISMEVLHKFIIALNADSASIYSDSRMFVSVAVYRNGMEVSRQSYSTVGDANGGRVMHDYTVPTTIISTDLDTNLSQYSFVKNLQFNYAKTDDIEIKVLLNNNVGYYYVSSGLNNSSRYFDEGNLKLYTTSVKVLRGAVDVTTASDFLFKEYDNKISNYV